MNRHALILPVLPIVLAVVVIRPAGPAFAQDRSDNIEFARPVRYAIGRDASSIALGDLNQDGFVDVVVAHRRSSTVSILMNREGFLGPPFEFPSESNPRSIVLGDFDGDGTLDLAVANFLDPVQDIWGGNVSVFRNLGDASFVRPFIYEGAGDGLRSLATADFDGDGRLDLAVASHSCGVAVLRNVGDGTFAEARQVLGCRSGPPDGAWPNSLIAIDLDGDGDMDLVAAMAHDSDFHFGTIEWVANDGKGGFVPGGPGGVFADGIFARFDREESVFFVKSGDLDGDKKIELITLSSLNWNSGGNVSILDDDGERTRYDTFGTAVAVGDLDCDGDLDLAVAGLVLTLMLNDGTGSFDSTLVVPEVGSPPVPLWDIALADLDHDGDLDLIVLEESRDSIAVLMNQSEILGDPCRPPLPGDADSDGDVDLADYLELAGCFAGPEIPVPAGCGTFDLDGDGDVDLSDVLIFQSFFTGGGRLFAPRPF